MESWRQAVKDSGIEATFTGGGTKGPALDRLSAAVAEACHGATRLPDLRLLRYRAHADYYFGQGAGDLLLEGKIIVKGREIQDEQKRSLAATTPSGMIALSLAGAAGGWSPWEDTSSRSATSCPRAPCWRQVLWTQTSRSGRETR